MSCGRRAGKPSLGWLCWLLGDAVILALDLGVLDRRRIGDGRQRRLGGPAQCGEPQDISKLGGGRLAADLAEHSAVPQYPPQFADLHPLVIQATCRGRA